MATLTLKLNESYKSQDGTFPIILKVEHRGQRRKIPIGYRVSKKYWTGAGVSGRHPDAALINAAISNKESEAKRYLADCQLHGKPVRLDLIGTGKTSYSFTEYLDKRAEQFKAAGKIVMKRKVSRFAFELRQSAGHEVYFEEVDLDFLRQLDQWQIKCGNVDNTRHKKFKFLREFYAHAIKEGKAPAPNPFEDYKIVAKPVKKDKLTEAEVKRIEGLKLAPGPVADARNLFLFSYYCKGQRFEVCAIFCRQQIAGNRIHFRTNKGNDYISVKIHGRLQAILEKYPSGQFVFPYVKEIPEDAEAYLKMIASKNTVVNKNLKIVAALVKIPTLTMHMARHSFAYHLKKVTDSINIIQDALGHSDQRTTQIYVKSLDDETLDIEMDKLYGQ